MDHKHTKKKLVKPWRIDISDLYENVHILLGFVQIHANK